MQTLTHTFVRDLTKIGPFSSEIRSGEDEVENLGLSNYYVVPCGLSILVEPCVWKHGGNAWYSGNGQKNRETVN